MALRRPALISSLLLLILLGLAAFVHFETKNLDRYRPRITEILKQITSHPVTLKRVNYAPLSGLFTLEINELEIKALDPTEPPMLQVQETLLSFSPLSLFSGKPEVSAIKLIRPQINLVLRDSSPLMERAQDTALASDKKLLKELGVGLTDLSIGRLSVQNGILAILDWDHPEGRTWVFDHVQMGIHALSPTRASPLTASARYRSIPFTANGQIGPLPESLDPFEMPILLSLDAKSIRLKNLQEILSTETIKVNTSRGYLTTLLHGSLSKGLQTSTWLQLDGIDLSRKDQKPVKAPQNESILDRISQRNEKKTLDLAFRQKSVIHMGWEAIPNLEFEEFFIYLDGTPILETKGWIRGRWRGPLKLDVKVLNRVNLDRFPWPEQFPLKGNSPSGTFQFSGIWPTTINYSADLDLSQTGIEYASLKKKANVPLALKFLISQVRDHITIQELSIEHPVIPNHSVKMSGSLTPSTELISSISWDTQNISEFFPVAKNWDASGITRLDMAFKKTEQSNWQAKGEITAQKGKVSQLEFQDLKIPFSLQDNLLNLPHMRWMSNGGRLEGMALIDLSQAPIRFDSRLTLAGMNLANLPGQPDDKESLGMEGYLFAGISLQGELNERSYLPTESLFGQAHIRLEPGRLTGINKKSLLETKEGESISLNGDKSLFWTRFETDVTLLNDKATLENIHLDNPESQISGRGSWDMGGERRFELKIDNPSEEGKPYLVHVEGDEITNSFRLQKRSTP
jgi:hypothetical protein